MIDFGEILRQLVECTPGAVGAIFVDWDGETVGAFAGEQPVLDLQIIGAQWGVVWMQLQRSLQRGGLGAPHELIVDGDRGSVLVRSVADGYYVVLTMRRECHLATARRELERSASRLRAEM